MYRDVACGGVCTYGCMGVWRCAYLIMFLCKCSCAECQCDMSFCLPLCLCLPLSLPLSRSLSLSLFLFLSVFCHPVVLLFCCSVVLWFFRSFFLSVFLPFLLSINYLHLSPTYLPSHPSIHVCMHALYERRYMYGSTHVRKCGCMDVRMYGCMDRCSSVWFSVYM